MNRLLKIAFLFIASITLFGACGNSSQEKAGEAPSEANSAIETPAEKKAVGPSGNGRTYNLSLANNIRGNWRSNDDPKSMWIFSDDQLIQMYGSKLVETVKFEVYEKCPEDCIGKEELERGTTCLRITSKKSEQCYLILELDRVKLRYRLPDSKKVISFKRL